MRDQRDQLLAQDGFIGCLLYTSQFLTQARIEDFQFDGLVGHAVFGPILLKKLQLRESQYEMVSAVSVDDNLIKTHVAMLRSHKIKNVYRCRKIWVLHAYGL